MAAIFEFVQSKQKVIQNAMTFYLASRFSALFYGSSNDACWDGDFSVGSVSWSGDDGKEFIIQWNRQNLVAAACIPECSRFEDGGVRFNSLGAPPPEIKKLFKEFKEKSSHEVITAGLWGVGDTVKYLDSDPECLEGGLEYFVDFKLEPNKFLNGLPEAPSYKALLSLEGDLEPIAELAAKLSSKAFTNYQLTSADLNSFKIKKGGIAEIRSDWKQVLAADLKPLGLII